MRRIKRRDNIKPGRSRNKPREKKATGPKQVGRRGTMVIRRCASTQTEELAVNQNKVMREAQQANPQRWSRETRVKQNQLDTTGSDEVSLVKGDCIETVTGDSEDPSGGHTGNSSADHFHFEIRRVLKLAEREASSEGHKLLFIGTTKNYNPEILFKAEGVNYVD